jgi:hypothetical protein
MAANTQHLAVTGGYLHISNRPLPDELGTLSYDWDDFAQEFRAEAGDGRYRVDARITRFLQHFFS